MGYVIRSRLILLYKTYWKQVGVLFQGTAQATEKVNEKKYYDYDSRHTVYQDRQSDCMEGIVDKCVYCLIEKFAKKPHKVVNEHLFFKIDINILNQYQTNINTDG